MQPLTEQLLHSPRVFLVLDELREALESEQARREVFLDSLSPEEKSEFVNGEVVVQSPARLAHNFASNALNVLLSAHVRRHRLGFVGHEKLLVSLTRNDYEPDVCFWRLETSSRFTPGQLRFPAPDFVAEVLSDSTEGFDRGVKMEDYGAHGVSEYWIVDPDRRRVEKYLARDGSFEPSGTFDTGTLASRAVPGFAIPVAALFDDAANLEALREIVAR